MIYRSQVTH